MTTPRLGFSVDALLPKARGGGLLKMGLVRLSDEEWLQPDPDLALRAAAFDGDPQAVQVMPEGREASEELAELVGIAGGIQQAARSHWEDMCLLVPGPEGYVLVAGAVAFPTDWSLADKIGLPLGGVHAPIHGYAEQLSAGVDHFMATLAQGAIFGRANWFVVADRSLRYRPDTPAEQRFAHVSAENAGETLFVRSERQTLRRLPRTGAIVFTIGVYLAPLSSLSPANVAKIAAAVGALGDGEHARRAAPHYAAPLSEWAARRLRS
ncbi:heme-dependent oxidative N-demethylase family protein [Tsuneonella sp. HG222]